MAFHFSLESLLRLRRGEQRQCELALQKENSEVNDLRRQIAELHEKALRIVTAPASGRFGAEFQFDSECQFVLEMQFAAIEKRLALALEQQAFAAAELRKAWQKHEALEILRHRQRDDYLLDYARKEQQQQDDLFLRRKSSG